MFVVGVVGLVIGAMGVVVAVWIGLGVWPFGGAVEEIDFAEESTNGSRPADEIEGSSTTDKAATASESTTTTTTTEATTTSSTTTTAPRPAIDYLQDLDVVEDSYFVNAGSMDIAGESYGRSVSIFFSGCYEEMTPQWNISSDYTSLSLTLGLNETATTDAVAAVTISTEVAELWYGEVSFGDKVPLELSVAGALRLSVHVVNVAGGNNCGLDSVENFVILGDAKVTRT